MLKKYPELTYDFDETNLIKDPNDNKVFFSLIDSILHKDYEEVIVDVSHGFRHLPLLAIISLIVENIENPNKITKILFAQEIVKFEEYRLIDLKEYLDISNITLALKSFLSTYKVLDMKLDNKLYRTLKDFSIHLTTNQFKEIFESDIVFLKEELVAAHKKFYFAKALLDEVNKFVEQIELPEELVSIP